LRLDHVPVVVQYNKRDLPDCCELATADRFDDHHRTSGELLEASAVTGVGVIETFFTLLERTWDVVDADVRLSARFGVEREAFLEAMRAHVGADPRRGGVVSSAS